MAMLPDGTTVLARAVIEHNLAAASRLYTCIYFDQLGALLGVPESAAEATAARMVQEDRLKVRGGQGSLEGAGLRQGAQDTAARQWALATVRCVLHASAFQVLGSGL